MPAFFALTAEERTLWILPVRGLEMAPAAAPFYFPHQSFTPRRRIFAAGAVRAGAADCRRASAKSATSAPKAMGFASLNPSYGLRAHRPVAASVSALAATG
jgi:hypothetical protein